MAHREKAHDQLLVVEQESGGAVILSAAGTIDMLTAPQLQQRVDAIVSRQPAALIVDLSRVEFLASAGIGVLVGIHNNADGMAYAVVAHGPATSRPLKLLGIDTMLKIYPSMAEAINGLGSAADEAECG